MQAITETREIETQIHGEGVIPSQQIINKIIKECNESNLLDYLRIGILELNNKSDPKFNLSIPLRFAETIGIIKTIVEDVPWTYKHVKVMQSMSKDIKVSPMRQTIAKNYLRCVGEKLGALIIEERSTKGKGMTIIINKDARSHLLEAMSECQ